MYVAKAKVLISCRLARQSPWMRGVYCAFEFFCFYIIFNNFEVISRWCLIETGSSMLTFIVMPH